MNKYKLKNIPFSLYLMLFVIGTVIAVALILTLSFFQVFESSLLSIAKTNAEQSITQVSSTIGNYSANVQNNMENITTMVSQKESKAEIKDYLQFMTESNNDIVSIMIYDSQGNLLDYTGKNPLKPTLDKNLSFLDHPYDRLNEYYISAPHVQNISENEYPWVISITQRRWSASYARNVYVSMDIRFLSMGTAIDEVGIGQHGYCFIVDSVGHIIYHPLQQLINLDIKQEESSVLQMSGSQTVVKDGVIYSSKDVPFNWKVIGVSYVNELVGERVTSATKNIVFILMVMIILSSILVYVLSRKLTRPVRTLVSAMNEFEKDTIDFKYSSTRGVREFTKLSHSFEHMVVQIQDLMERVKQEEITLRKTELKALQAQINPHFLYNTLDSIQWMCERGKNDDAVRMVGALAQLFRISISKGYELIPIEKEIQHSQNYLVIQSYRYKGQFVYHFDIDENVLPYLCHKITLQPIIENALYHGISGMVDQGTIMIKARKQGEDIIFTIEDDGAGMSEEQVVDILRKELTDSKGIGVKNVNDRIKIYFGEEYGITVESELDVGTCITIRIPAIKERNYE